MIPWLPRAVFGTALVSLLAYSQLSGPEKRWYKGNLHTHTLNSDGDSTPNEVATWYREHRYNFLTLSDHNYLTDIAGLNAVHGAKEKFLMIPGEEVTDSFDKKPIHMNSYNPASFAAPRHGSSVADTIQNNTNEIRTAKGLPSLNHPNFGWAVSVKDMLAVKNLGLFEVYNGHPMVNNDGGGGVQSLDELWDVLLTALPEDLRHRRGRRAPLQAIRFAVLEPGQGLGAGPGHRTHAERHRCRDRER
jgi:hypothetical protein